MNANKKWLAIPEEFRIRLKKNIFCSHCKDAVGIENFTIEDHPSGIVLEGKCQVCGKKVARVVESE
ncbi:hypothetical protein V1498_04050 [Peribacillus sp. SCS-26]|uniref:hypothetical protein n=1 Tax=Paraperibacillus marinus TaxID=3115295 RepID=UPI003905EF8E